MDYQNCDKWIILYVIVRKTHLISSTYEETHFYERSNIITFFNFNLNKKDKPCMSNPNNRIEAFYIIFIPCNTNIAYLCFLSIDMNFIGIRFQTIKISM